MLEKCDVIFQGGRIIDGSGKPGCIGDVGITGDSIVAIGDCDACSAEETVDVTGLVVAPGFIDVHTHDDTEVQRNPRMACKVTQGVTSVIVGNCGISAAPFTPNPSLPAPFTGKTLHDPDTVFPSVANYAERLRRQPAAVNVALLVGHSSLRANVMGFDLDRPAQTQELNVMQSALDDALSQGAIGMSSGLDYPAASAAPRSEMVALAKVLKQHANAVYTTHMRNEDDYVVEAVRETVDTGRAAGVSVVISHHKCSGTANFGRSAETLRIIEAARTEGRVALDCYPYVASSTSLLERFLPAADAILVNWSDPHPEMSGKMLNDIAVEWNITREEACARLHPAGAIYFDLDEGDLRRILAYGPTMVGSDGIPSTRGPHPRLWGTFPRVLGHYARDLGLFALETAVHKMTRLSARVFGLTGRGELAAGCKADICVFDPNTVIDKATFKEPEKPATGIRHVMVNGTFALKDGTQTSALSGDFLTH